MATRTDPKVETRVIPAVSGWCPWLELDDMLPVAIETPDQWTAASIAVKARMRSSGDGGLVYDDKDAGTQILIAAGADRFVRLDERLFLGATAIAFAADGQAAARTISVAMLPAVLLLGVAR
jgi:hypothetical protein